MENWVHISHLLDKKKCYTNHNTNMQWYNPLKMFSRGRAKSAEYTGGFEVLRKLIGGDLTATSQLETYRKSLYVFACISKIAEKVGSIDLEMYKVINSAGDVKEIKNHPALDLLYRCNPFQTRAEFWELMMINLKTTGSAFWYKVRNTRGQVVELWNVRPDLMTVVSDPVNFIKEYRLTRDDGSTVVFAPEDIVHFKYPDPLSQYMGMSPIKPAERRIQTEDYATAYQRDFFLNSARPDAIIKNPQLNLTPEQKSDIREAWNKRHGGVGNSSKVAILEGGLEYQVISVTQKEMDYIESMRFTRDDILVAFKVPKPVVAVTDDVNRANAETAMRIFLSETIMPEVKKIVEKINEELIGPEFGEEFYIEAEDVTPEDKEATLKEYESGLQFGYLLINEVRQSEGLAPVAGGWSFYKPINEVPMGGLSQTGTAGDKSLTRDQVYLEKPKKAKKKFDFRGHRSLYSKIVIREELEKSIKKLSATAREDLARKQQESKKARLGMVHKDVAGEGETVKQKISFLKDKDVRVNYHSMINKKLDDRTTHLKADVNKHFESQQARVQKKLESKFGKADGVKVSVEEIFNEKDENSITMDFIEPYITDMVVNAAKDALSVVAPAEAYKDSARITKFIKDRTKEFAISTSKTTMEKLSATIAEGVANAEGISDLSKRVADVYDEFPSYRSELIARTEATAANAEGSLDGFRQSGVANAKEWINSGDGRVRDEHEDGIGVGGEIVELDADFSNGLSYPSEPNCRCVLGPAFIEK